MCWDARCIFVFVFLKASANFRPCFSNNNVHVAWTLLQPISLPNPPPNNFERCNKEVNNMTPINIEHGERGSEFNNYHQIVQTLFSMIVALTIVCNLMLLFAVFFLFTNALGNKQSITWRYISYPLVDHLWTLHKTSESSSGIIAHGIPPYNLGTVDYHCARDPQELNYQSFSARDSQKLC